MLLKNRDLQTLGFFCILEIALGLWLGFPVFVNVTVIHIIQGYLPLWLLSIIFIGGGFYNLFFPKRLISYVTLVSMPFAFLGIVFFQTAIINGNLSPGTIFCIAIGLYSSIFIGQVLKRI